MIYTFYSYKGGVGRSMALANIAELFYRDGMKVLMIDWDLEAPGLENFFYPEKVELEERLKHPGLVDMLNDYKEYMSKPGITDEENFSPISNSFNHYYFDIHPEQGNNRRGKLLLLPAGKRDGEHFIEYTNFVRTFDWLDFYDNWKGGQFFEWLRQQAEQLTDVILIDSRTGLSEMGGVCTYQLANVVVMFCATNKQNMDGIAEMVRKLRSPEVLELRKQDNRPLEIVITPSRVEEVAEQNELEVFQKEFLSRFATSDFWIRTLPRIDQLAWGALLWDLKIPYLPHYSFGEEVAVTEQFAKGENLREAYRNLATLLSYLAPAESALFTSNISKEFSVIIDRAIKTRDSSPNFKVALVLAGDVVQEEKIIHKTVESVNDLLIHRYATHRLNIIQPSEAFEENDWIGSCDIITAVFEEKGVSPADHKNLSTINQTALVTIQKTIASVIEKAKSKGNPRILLYQKRGASISEITETNLYEEKRYEFKAGKTYLPEKTFEASEFGVIFQNDLIETTSRLLKENDEAPIKEILDDKSDIEQRWLKEIGLKENPFRHWDAEERDPYLPDYFSRSIELQQVTTSQLMRERKIWFFGGDEGYGKTALRKFLASKGRPTATNADTICFEVDQREFERLITHLDEIPDFGNLFFRAMAEKCLPIFSGESLAISMTWDSQGKVLENIAILSAWLREYGVNWVLCLVDPAKEYFTWKGTQISTASILESLISFPESGGVGLRFFLPTNVKNMLDENLPSTTKNGRRYMQIQWDKSSLIRLIAKRMTALSVDQSAPYHSMGQICENELAPLVDIEIASLAQGSPRAAIWLANRLFEEHCQVANPSSLISSQAWENVKSAWWDGGEGLILGATKPSRFLVLGKRIFYRTHEIILSGRSHQLLLCLALAKDGFSVNNELIQFGWPNENPAGISEKALNEAVRRMKNELVFQLKKCGVDVNSSKWVKSVRKLGYQIEYPETVVKNMEAKG